jgi:dolichol-phosphate mannosyltransferase
MMRHADFFFQTEFHDTDSTSRHLTGRQGVVMQLGANARLKVSMNENPHEPQSNSPPTNQLGGLELTVVVPTYSEHDNIVPLVKRLEETLAGIAWEVVFVDDDSPDGTAALAKDIARQNPRVRCIRRVIRRGLAGACIEGILSSAARFVAVIDGDMQHDEKMLPRMLDILATGEKDLVVGSRYVEGGSANSFSKGRGTISRLATTLARGLTGVSVSDPMSGFFMMRRSSFDPLAARLSTQGFKILLDIVITSRGTLRIAEVPYVFGARTHGESKLDAQVALDFLGLLLAKLTGGAVTPRFLSFLLVGTSGLVVHLGILRLALVLLGQSFAASQAIATLIAMTSNFFLNNVLTYRDKRLSGFAMVKGLFGFYAVSSVGALANISIASWLYANDSDWWIAGVAGALMSAVWNYALSNIFVWRVK